ncbi:glucosidase II beta subunit-like protein-domain-containing protein [Echria macrotheca]|uniref:Endoplasmic reticulum lectin n=1 Tax=Echria macrotheca TaxID=438768 RepID=A0AAJ0F572_9PEZI|nr:glucosidase II beta subunit-like protein-domain-containing protein [Echria macrotheca]
MRRLHLVFLASLPFCRARQPGFSIHDDLLAHPQFEVVFSDAYILEPDAVALLGSKSTRSTTYAPDASQTDLASQVRESAAADTTGYRAGANTEDGSQEVTETYEILGSSNLRYLCSIPSIARTPDLNKTATELAKAEEAREISRASARGWELMSGLDGHCLYFMSGWWSYSFCYGRDIVQFHALPSGVNDGAPVRDPKSHEYVLGTMQPTTRGRKPQTDVANKGAGEAGAKGVAPPNAELQVKGDQRYLVQRLDGGTICDLTGRPRTIEIQYHCSPGTKNDRIGWIKEVTTCTYLMVVQTDRLCADVAFLPPKETHAHPISCRPIIRTADDAEAWQWRRAVDAREKMGVAGTQQARSGKDASRQAASSGLTIGGVVIGGKRVLGTEGEPDVVLAPPRGITASRQTTETWQALEKYLSNQKKKIEEEGGSPIETLTTEDLEKLGVDKETVEALKKELQNFGDEFWEIAVEVIPPTEDEGQGDAGGDGKENTKRARQTQKGNNNGGKAGQNGQKGGEAVEDEDEEEGSHEVFFRDEL